MNLYMINMDYIYYVMFVVCVVSFFGGMLTHYLFNRQEYAKTQKRRNKKRFYDEVHTRGYKRRQKQRTINSNMQQFI